MARNLALPSWYRAPGECLACLAQQDECRLQVVYSCSISEKNQCLNHSSSWRMSISRPGFMGRLTCGAYTVDMNLQ